MFRKKIQAIDSPFVAGLVKGKNDVVNSTRNDDERIRTILFLELRNCACAVRTRRQRLKTFRSESGAALDNHIYSLLTSTSAFLTIETGVSGFPPGLSGIPRYARTAFLGGGSRVHVMNLIALSSVLAAI